MPCAECRDQLVAFGEGLLSQAESAAVREHLEACPACLRAWEAQEGLLKDLEERRAPVATLDVEAAVMARIRRPEPRISPLRRLASSWVVRLGAAAGLAAGIAMALLVPGPKVHAGAVQAMARGVQAASGLTAVHLRGHLRSAPDENFAHINPGRDFCPIELWRQDGAWRVEKPGRVALMDGRSTVLYLPGQNLARREGPGEGGFDTGWLHRLADLGATLAQELDHARAMGWRMELAESRGADGHLQSVVTLHARIHGPADDYIKQSFFGSADTRRVYRFDAATGALEGAQIYLVRFTGDVLVFELTHIEANPAPDPSRFRLELPADVAWWQPPVPAPGDERYIALSPEQAARAFFEACGREDWGEAGKFLGGFPPVPRLRGHLGGVQVLAVGEAFTSAFYPGRFVPYQVRLRSGAVLKHNLALKRDPGTGTWYVDGGI